MELIIKALKIAGSKHDKVPQLTTDFKVWGDWYRGSVRNFHEYRLYNGENYLLMKRKGLQMAKKVCEDWADLILNEKVEVTIPEESENEKLQHLLRDINFWVIGNESVEKSFALGLGALVLSVDDIEIGDKGSINITDDSALKVDFVDRYKIYPLLTENKIIKEAAFLFENSDSKIAILHLRNEDGIYEIHTYKEYLDVKIDSEYSKFNTKSKIAWFQIMRPFISSNNLNSGYDASLGTSIFANSIDTLMAVDTKYDSFDNEFIAGRKRLFASDEMFNVHNKKDGEKEKTFDPLSSIYHMLPAQGDNKQYLEDKSGELRANDHITAINMELNLLSSKTGMGENHYTFGEGGIATATEVVSENSKLFRTLKKHQILVDSLLRNMVVIMVEASKNFTKNGINFNTEKMDDIGILFDDSIIEDKGTEMERDKNLVMSGMMSVIEFRVRWFGEDVETATENYRKYFKNDIMNKFLPILLQGGMTPEDYLIEVYGVADQKLIDYITEKIKVQDYGGFIDDLYEDTE